MTDAAGLAETLGLDEEADVSETIDDLPDDAPE